MVTPVRRATEFSPVRANGKPVTPELLDRIQDKIKLAIKESQREYRDLTNGISDQLSGSFNYVALRLTIADEGDVANCYGRATSRDGGEGQFVFRLGVATDNDGTILVVPGVGWWERFTTSDVRASWFGVKGGDGATYTTQLQAATNYALTVQTDRARVVILPRGTVHTGTLTIDEYAIGQPFTGFTIVGEGRSANVGFFSHLKYVGPAQGTLIDVLGTPLVKIHRCLLDGNNLTKKLLWFRPKFVAAVLVNAPFDCVVDDVTFAGMGDYVGSCGMVLGDAANPGAQASEIRAVSCVFQASRTAVNVITGWKTEASANVKNFYLQECSFNALGIGVDWTHYSGCLHIENSPFQSCALDMRLDGTAVVTACPSEGSDRRLEQVGSSNPANVVMTGCVTDMSGVSTYPIVMGAKLQLNNCAMSNGALEFRINATTGSPFFDSIGNSYHLSRCLPFFVNGIRVVGDGATVSSEFDDSAQFPNAPNQRLFSSRGDWGSTGGIGTAMDTVFPAFANPGQVSWRGGLSTRTIASAGAGWRDSTGITLTPVNERTWKITVAKEAFYAAALTQTIAVGNIWTRTQVQACVADITTAFAGVAGLAMTVGHAPFSGVIVADADAFLLSFAPTAVGRRGLADADLGVGLARATAIQGGMWFWDLSAPGYHKNQITVTLTGATNLGNGSVTNLTAGAIEFFIRFEIFA